MELFTIVEIAQKLKTTKAIVYKLIKAGHITALKLGNMKVTSFELERFIKECEGKDFTDIDNVTEFVS
ncbi:MAG: helix-turn-helix domain-containing protein [Clostridium sp.]